jgi:hypothetical protein
MLPEDAVADPAEAGGGSFGVSGVAVDRASAGARPQSKKANTAVLAANTRQKVHASHPPPFPLRSLSRGKRSERTRSVNPPPAPCPASTRS